MVTIQYSPKHWLLRAYEHDLGVQNSIGEADFHGFCIRNWSDTEQLRKMYKIEPAGLISRRFYYSYPFSFSVFSTITFGICF